MTIAAFLFVCALFAMVQFQIYQLEKRFALLRDVMLSYEMGPIFDELEKLPRLDPNEKHWKWNGEPVTWYEFLNRLEALPENEDEQ